MVKKSFDLFANEAFTDIHVISGKSSSFIVFASVFMR